MRFSGGSIIVISFMLGMPSGLQAQEIASRAESLPEAVAEGESVDGAYEISAGVESGTSVIERQEIEARAPGSGDVNQLLKIFPTVQFDRNEGVADRDTIQDIRPADISISGGYIYDNLITLDGMDANSRLDVTNDNPFNFNETAGNSSQTLWLDSELIGTITLRDSNISAEYGRFTGGALDIESRDAKREWGASANFNYTEDALVNYIISERSRAAYEESGDPLPDAPKFRKLRYGGSIDVPINDRGALLFAANRSSAEVLNFRSESYDEEPGYRTSVSENYLISGNYDLTQDLRLTAKLSYSPYESEAANANGVDNLIVSKGGGLGGRFVLSSTGEWRWNIETSFAHSDTSRTAPPANYSIPSDTTNGAVCSNTNCTQGGFGDLDQTQDTYALKGRIEHDLGPGALRAGFDYQRIEALRARAETAYAFSRSIDEDEDENSILPADIVCVDGDSLTCTTGEYALGQYSEYRAYIADISIDSIGLWAEYDMAIGPLDLRAGIRYDYESFLGNHNIAPRFSAAWNIAPQWTVSLGANRYYGRSMLTYAIREKYPDNFIYRRTATLAEGKYVVSDDDWYLYSTSVSTGYSGSDLKTPYSDELTAAVSAPLLGGTARVKGIYRRGRDGFARSLRLEEEYTLETGQSAIRRFYEMTNDGRSEYKGVSLEWVRRMGKHTFALNTNFSKTGSNTSDYLDTAYEVEEEGEQVLFAGEIISLADLLDRNQRLEFASPFIVNASWTALWFKDRLTTNVNLRYRDGFNQIEDTDANETVDGSRYDVYDFVRYPDRINVDLNAQFDILRKRQGTLTADIRVSNVLNTIPAKNSTAIAQPYQYGRSFWLGLKYNY